ncbi:ABC transporter permease [Evansella halocellulosilytica]|uniref:ABC transporter permease n=1 Tax=Evansella halocellulosilytica TaxID=2011013 RepID=UPI000BB7DE91|nr:proline/glycine betaine ABC transporter permease [Evansella halocellulosilytica]
MIDFPEQLKFEAGQYVDQIVSFLNENLGFFFDAIRSLFTVILLNIENFLLWLPWWLVIFAVFFVGWRVVKLSSGIVYGFLIFLVGAFGLWELMMITFAIVLTSVIIALVIGIPTGIIMSYSRGFSNFMRPVLDAMQTMPSFVYLIPAIFFFGLGKVPAVFATLIYAVPPVIRLTELAIRNVSKEMVEAAESFGSSRMNLLTKVQLPQAMPTILAGVNQTTMMALAMVVIASMIGAQGLGEEVLISINRIDIARGFEAGISIVFMAIIIDRITNGIGNRFQRNEGH